MGKKSYWSLLIFCAFFSQGFAILSDDNIVIAYSVTIEIGEVFNMRIKSNLILLIFCAVWSLGFAVLSDENIEESWNLLIRKKRVIDKTRNGGLPVQITRAPYLVNILKNGISHCSGTILESDIIITTSDCIPEIRRVTYTILSNSSLRNNGTPHRITRRSSAPAIGFVLFKITPPIQLQNGLNAKIDLFHGVIPPYASGFFSGWGCMNQDHWHVHTFTEQLMQTKLPILTYEECTAHFGTPLPEQQFCTLDTSRRRSPCLGDEGGPLVYDNRLLGILLFRGRPTWVYPDIFINFNNLNIHDMVNFHMNALRRIH